MSYQTLIRRSRLQSCIAHWEPTATGDVRLLRVSPDAGPPPDAAHLVGALFADQRAMRRAVLAAMRGPVGDTLDRVLLTRAACARWDIIASEAAKSLPSGIDPTTIPDEKARAISGGRLLVWVDLPGGGVAKLVLQPGEWAWRTMEH